MQSTGFTDHIKQVPVKAKSEFYVETMSVNHTISTVAVGEIDCHVLLLLRRFAFPRSSGTLLSSCSVGAVTNVPPRRRKEEKMLLERKISDY